MTRVPPRPLRTLSILGLVTVLVAVAVLLPSLVMPPASPSAGPTVSVRDETPALDGVFDPGIILAAASNGSATLLGGIGVYTKLPRDFSLPVLAELLPSVGGAHAVNLTAAVNQYFYAGGIYAIGWNGTAWLIAGQATWNGTNYGTAVAMTGSGFRNLTPAFEPFFVGGGIFAVGWNGTSWLLGGNSTSGVALVALRGTSATGLSSRLPSTAPDRWLQLLQWNGAEWLVGGEGVFGTLDGTDFTNLLGATPFAGTGAWAGAGDGTGWIAGGGGGRLVVVGGSGVTVVPPLT
ncbi:MAG: hypothetical protein ACREDE_08125, partial [Thermoplasmata archaeon]